MRRFPYLHLVLFVVTFLSMILAGAIQKGLDIVSEPSRIFEGLPFALTLMIILLSHELSHYFASRRHHTEATLPYFIPAPSLIGTFGAFIKMKSPIITRKALIDIGASGPIVGFCISLVAAVVGMSQSTLVKVTETSGVLGLGDSILFSTLSRLFFGSPPESYDIILHPVAFAGWIGFFVTSLNLIPIGQLDGGHIAYALFGESHRLISRVLVVSLFVAGIFLWEGWMIWAILMLVLGLRHPPVIYWDSPLDSRRRFIGGLSLVIFIITFIPFPFRIL